jgi:hypothetical protein
MCFYSAGQLLRFLLVEKSMDLKGKVALVTGTAHGIGMATVQQVPQNGLRLRQPDT